jgi:hypothetical protein
MRSATIATAVATGMRKPRMQGDAIVELGGVLQRGPTPGAHQRTFSAKGLQP